MDHLTTSWRAHPLAVLVCAVLVAVVLTAATAAAVVAGFDDVPDDHPHAAGIGYLAGTGITTGCTSTSFCPDTGMTRGQMATFIRRLSGADPAVPPSVRAATAVAADTAGQAASASSLDGYEIVERTETMLAATLYFEVAPILCPAGKRAVGGGATVETFAVAVNHSAPTPTGDGWEVHVRRLQNAGDIDVTLRVICLPV